MNNDEFAFFNQQLAAMLREGIPLEGALKQLCSGMRNRALREEITLLENDLARGTPLKDAVARRNLPEFYRRMVSLAASGNDLPGVLTLLADHYYRANALWTRLKGILVYPLLVIIVSLALTVLLSIALSRLSSEIMQPLLPNATGTLVAVWVPPLLMSLLAALGIVAATSPRWRGWLRWRLPGFREASLSELASALALVLKNGTDLSDALALAQTLESGTPAGPILSQWRSLVEAGKGKPSQWPAVGRPIPPLFLWLVQQAGEDIAAGFQKAADIYHARAVYRTELALYGALPVSVLLLGQMAFWQVFPLVRALISSMNILGDMGGMN
jgi:type II secretory pathway component PulF